MPHEIDGTVVQGNSSNVLDALNSLHWLVRSLAKQGLSLKENDIVMSGSVPVPTPISLPAHSMTLAISGFQAMAEILCAKGD